MITCLGKSIYFVDQFVCQLFFSFFLFVCFEGGIWALVVYGFLS